MMLRIWKKYEILLIKKDYMNNRPDNKIIHLRIIGFYIR